MRSESCVQPPRPVSGEQVLFYTLSMLTGVLECGWIFYGVLHAFPLWKILLFPLAYHIGNLFPKPFSLNRTCLRIICATGLLSGLLSEILPAILPPPIGGSLHFPLTCAALILISAPIQSVRSGMKSDDSRVRTLKRMVRVIGFILAPLAVVIPTVLLTISSVAALYALRRYEGSFHFTRVKRPGGFNTVMLFHQLHYFSYAHVTLASVGLLTARSASMSPNGSVCIAAGLFCLTWISYLAAEPILTGFTSRHRPVFYAGHIGIALLLTAMIFTWRTPAMFIILWIVIGLFGGTVYTIKETAKEAQRYDSEDMTLSENYGHVLGLLVSVCTAAFFGEVSLPIQLGLGAVSALCAVLTMARIKKGSK